MWLRLLSVVMSGIASTFNRCVVDAMERRLNRTRPEAEHSEDASSTATELPRWTVEQIDERIAWRSGLLAQMNEINGEWACEDRRPHPGIVRCDDTMDELLDLRLALTGPAG